MRAKLYGFMDRPHEVLRRYPLSDTSMPARYARAISTYRFGDLRDAIAQIDGLIHVDAEQSLFLRAQRPGAARSRTPRRKPSRRCSAPSSLRPIRRSFRSCSARRLLPPTTSKLVGRGDPAVARRADQRTRNPSTPIRSSPWPMGARTTSPMLTLPRREAAFARGDNKTARELAERAKQRFPIGSPGWVRADDIVAFNKNVSKNPLYRSMTAKRTITMSLFPRMALPDRRRDAVCMAGAASAQSFSPDQRHRDREYHQGLSDCAPRGHAGRA